ncbi:translation initiation factor 2 [Actinoplanes sp. NPDC051861]|uniref:translation initiation factor 2 n=1 Tax=Actinoplanes sp. NPDC051861 TaxID=3155170 RepID=UPI0034121FCB
MSSPTSPPDDDAFWQRPDPSAESLGRPPRGEPAAPEPPGYAGPPHSEPPIAGWRPPTIAHPPPPRSMPAQDIDALDEAEGSARTVTYGVGLMAGAVALVLMCLLCARIVF